MSDTKPTKGQKPKAAARPQGRPSDFTVDMADRICERLAEGESLRSICRDDSMPNRATVFRWLAANKEFSDQYAHACEARAEGMFEDMLDIADETTFDTVIGENGDRANTEWISRSKLRVDTRKWMLARMQPKKYGDKITQELTGADGGAIQVQSAAALTDDQLAAIAAGKPCT
ncbi:terminase small subunit protein [Massilia sp. TN1-12]|uniref:terminase small subunit-like protein n=1 Tax=Massilia paldalensis TaxID=3377675 RepID=UPI00384C4E9A